MKRYFAYGLEISSEIDLPELLTSHHEGDPDVSIRYGVVPKSIDAAKKTGILYQAGVNAYLLRLDQIAHYYVANGDQITIDPQPGGSEDDIRLFLLCSSFGALLHQRKSLIMHASAIKYGEEAVLFSGNSGIGKSSTAKAFNRMMGHQMLTDDICVIRFVNGQPMALPGFPHSKLWDDTLEHMNIEVDGLKKIRKKINKRLLPMHESFYPHPLPIRAIYFLRSYNKDEVLLNDVEKADKFKMIKNMTYRYQLLEGLGVHGHHFLQGTMLSNQIPLKIILRPQRFSLDKVVAVIDEDLKSPIPV